MKICSVYVLVVEKFKCNNKRFYLVPKHTIKIIMTAWDTKTVLHHGGVQQAIVTVVKLTHTVLDKSITRPPE